jgi:phosphonate degradation associated HDIG domain protein
MYRADVKKRCGQAKMANARSTVVTDILTLFAERGESAYGGEAVSQRAHALQAAHFARQAGADEALVVAALLHDIGHLLHGLPDDAPDHGVDDRHEALAARWLAGRFGPGVIEPVRLHVAAKRYLCAVEPGYYEALSEPSKLSLQLQGGAMSREVADQFRALPHAKSSVTLRRCDDSAKVPELIVPELVEYLSLIERVVIES